ncbi:alpha/beta hydrolase [Microbacterium sp. zg-YB36]|uniref:alpha/beta fold hydrolase n=1 Tax=Microbacterium sp. zg-YB36 TaxID=2969407 RepID=UPI00214CB8F0|nr:alpha/beta hydrolase [Microbacterium sp. zg-YB36]MDL5351608.1 alpha/beta hydrolase [Microbacterium sp. zg-YB36]
MATNTNEATTVLIAGHWLGAWAWDEVLEHLTTRGCRALPVTLPGLDEADSERASRTLDDQVAAIERVMAAAADGEPVVVVAHSGANGPVSLVLDRHPELVRRVVWVDSGPATPGMAFAPDTPEDLDELPLPPFETLGAQASLEGLSAEALARFRSRAVPQPGPVLRQPVELTDEARLQVPATLVCCSIPSAQGRELADAGHPMFAEVAKLENVEFVDLPTGHWPMWSRPRDLAEIIAAAGASPVIAS